MAGVAEGLSLGQRLGLDPSMLTDIFNSSSARCWSSDTYNPCPVIILLTYTFRTTFMQMAEGVIQRTKNNYLTSPETLAILILSLDSRIYRVAAVLLLLFRT